MGSELNSFITRNGGFLVSLTAEKYLRVEIPNESEFGNGHKHADSGRPLFAGLCLHILHSAGEIVVARVSAWDQAFPRQPHSSGTNTTWRECGMGAQLLMRVFTMDQTTRLRCHGKVGALSRHRTA
jgi:hypothetical protein